MLSCDFQRFMETNILAKHVVAFISAFYVIVLTETDKEDSDKSMWDYFMTTLVIYGIFLLSTKAKAQFVWHQGPVISNFVVVVLRMQGVCVWGGALRYGRRWLTFGRLRFRWFFAVVGGTIPVLLHFGGLSNWRHI